VSFKQYVFSRKCCKLEEVVSECCAHVCQLLYKSDAGVLSAPTNVRLLNLTQNLAVITWDAVACLDRGGRLVHYEVRLDDIDFRSDIIVSYVMSMTASFPLLTPYRLFAARVRYVSSVGPGPYSIDYEFRTPATGE